MITFCCLSCSQPYSVGDEKSGMSAQCKRCGRMLKVPGDPQSDWVEGSPPLTRQPVTANPDRKPAAYVRCRKCLVSYLAEPGDVVRCIPCGLQLRAPVPTPKPSVWDDIDSGRATTGVRFSCPKCLAEYTADPGDAIRCVPCGLIIKAPVQKPKPPSSCERPTPVVSDEPASYEPESRARCIGCSTVIPYRAFGRGKCVRCENPDKSRQKRKWTGEDIGVAIYFGLAGLLVAIILVACIYAAFRPTPPQSQSPHRLSDDERIERMQREQRDLQETNRWQQERVKADQWDRMNGRKAGH